ncbi:hypothetical protein ACI65C_004500 [Semiaphis heraclei]
MVAPGACELEAGLQYMRSALRTAANEARMACTKEESPGIKRLAGLLQDISKTLSGLIDKKGKLRLATPPSTPMLKKPKGEEAPQLAVTTGKPMMVDASTDTVLTPSWWDSDAVFEAESRMKTKRGAHKPHEAVSSKVLVNRQTRDTEVEPAMDTDAETPWSSVVRRGTKKWKTATDLRPPTAAAPTKPAVQPKPPAKANKPPAILVRPAEGKSLTDTVRSVRSCGLSAQDISTNVTMRETRDGSLLMELAKGAKSTAAAKTIAAAISEKLGDSQLGVLVEKNSRSRNGTSRLAGFGRVAKRKIGWYENPGRQASRNLMMQTAREMDADVIIISEHCRNQGEDHGWFDDSSSRCTLFVNDNIPIEVIGPPENGFRWLQIAGLRLYSVYWPPASSVTLTSYADFLARLEGSIRTSGVPVVLAGDFNAKSPVWCSPTTDARGEHLADMAASLNLHAANTGSPTFVRGASESHIDITFVSDAIAQRLTGWRVLMDVESASYHKYIVYSIQTAAPRPDAAAPQGWNWSAECVSCGDENDDAEHMISRKNLEVINRVSFPPTFRNRGSACLDVTLASKSVRAVDWSAVHDLTSSDHAVISFEILASDARPKEGTPRSARYDWSRTNWIEFRKTLKSEANSRAGELECPDADTCAEALSEVLTQACETHMRRLVAGKHRAPPWWNRDLERELSTLGRRKVRLRNAKSALRRRAIRAVFVRRKAEHKRNCFKARRDSWRSFVTETGNRNPWGPVYKWLKSGGSRPSERIPATIRTADGSFISTLLDTGERLMEALVPSDTAENESAEQIAIREETGVSLGAFKPASPETAAEFDPPAADFDQNRRTPSGVPQDRPYQILANSEGSGKRDFPLKSPATMHGRVDALTLCSRRNAKSSNSAILQFGDQ